MDDKSKQLQDVTGDLASIVTSQLEIPEESKQVAASAIGHLVKVCFNFADRYGYYSTLANAREAVIKANTKAIENALTQASDEEASENTKRLALQKAIEYVHNPIFQEFLDELKKPTFKRKKRKKATFLRDDGAWWEQFTQFLSTRREKWRDKLLGKALSVSAQAMDKEEEPIAFSTLWRIATMPAHSFIDLMQFKAIAGILESSDDINIHFIPGTFNFIDKTEFSHPSTAQEKKRLLTELTSSIISDGFADDAGLIAMDYPGKIMFHIDDTVYDVVKGDEYEDPLEYQEIDPDNPEQAQTERKKLAHKIRMYGFYLNYIGEEVLDLSDDVEPSPEREDILKAGIEMLRKDDNVLFVVRSTS